MANIRDKAWDKLVAKADAIMEQLIDDYCGAPVKGTYIRMLGRKTTSKYEVQNEAITNIKFLNEIAMARFGKAVVTFDDEPTPLPKMTVNK